MALADAPAPPRPRFPRRRRTLVECDPDTVVRSVLRRREQILEDRDRGQWNAARLQRYAKYRGGSFMQKKSFPWDDCSNVHLPILQTSELRMNAGLNNVIRTMRPLLSARATSRVNVEKESRINELLDAQLFVDHPQVERILGDFVSNGLQDGNAVVFTSWVRDERELTLVRHVPEGELEDHFRRLWPSLVDWTVDAKVTNRMTIRYLDRSRRTREADVEVFEDDDGGFEFVIRTTELLFDGPIMQNVPIASVLVPTRVENLQPPSEANPNGAPYVFLQIRYRIGDVKRLQGTPHGFNVLSHDDLSKIIQIARGGAGRPPPATPTDRLETQKDQAEGTTHAEPPVMDEHEEDHLSVEMVMAFDLWEGESVYWVVALDAKVLCEARLLTEKWPSVRPYRPLAEFIPIPVPGRWLGISLLELGESLYDLIKGTFDISFDSGVISNLPIFFYSLQSGLKGDPIKIAPGFGYGLPGRPQDTVWFPTLGTRDQTWAFRILALAMQIYERQMSVGGLQSGQVPTGKASALRTFGTTMALLQQGDVRADQLLLNLFTGLRQIYRNFHAMNRSLLPEGKELRVLGYEGPRAQAYRTIEKIEDIDADMDFDFRPDFVLSNPALLAQTMEKVMTVVLSPLLFQMRITDPQKAYNLVRDWIRSLRLDPQRYVGPPVEQGGPPLLAEEAIDLILKDQAPQGYPMEGAETHLKKLGAFQGTEGFGLLQPQQLELFRNWVRTVQGLAQQDRTVQAALAFQQALQASPAGGGVDTTISEPPVTGTTAGMAPEESNAGLV